MNRDSTGAGKRGGLTSAARERVHARALALALAAGRIPPVVTQADYEQAKREITGESDLDRQNAVLDDGAAAGPQEGGGGGARARRTVDGS